MSESNEPLPKHVAIIMDGNGRWAKKRRMPRIAGHRAGVENVRAIVRHCAEAGVGTLTLFAFSSENWRRPKSEVNLLFELFIGALEQEIDKLDEAGVRLRVIGDREPFPQKLRRCISDAENKTAHNTRLNLVIAANYGGQWDIAQAARQLARAAVDGEIEVDDINAESLGKFICLNELPEPDLFIRSGGEQRISNFLLWQLAYCEMYFTDCLWPDFDVEQFQHALADFATRQRRFGMTGEQVSGEHDEVVGFARE